jgi:hypothetical protein
MSPFGNDVSFEQFSTSAETFLKMAECADCSKESVQNGFKALELLYFAHGKDWTHEEINESIELMKTAARHMVHIEDKE